MQPHLVFTLAATLAAMGDLAGHERRGSLAWPGRSALLGLMGAAMGVRRNDDFSALESLSVGVAVFDDGQPLRDYHTVQTVPTAAARRPNSRPEALRQAAQRLNTTITLRDYRAGVLYGVVVWGGDLAPLEKALNAPCFTLYLGRKSCSLSAPPAARIVTAGSAVEALSHLVLPPWTGLSRPSLFITDAEDGDAHVDTRHDQPLDRRRWHFASRRVAFRQIGAEDGR